MKNYTKCINRYSFMKSNLSSKLAKFDANKSEWENMKNNGYDRIWDCGNFVFTKKNPEK